jgi:hypothetical protein
MTPLLLATPSVPPPIIISLTPSLFKSQALGDESVGMESVNDCQEVSWEKEKLKIVTTRNVEYIFFIRFKIRNV